MTDEPEKDSAAENPAPTGEDESRRQNNMRLLRCAYVADEKGVIAAIKAGADVNATDPATGLTALHIAVGTNNLTLTRLLVKQFRARFMPDAQGRWPTLIAAQVRVDDALADYLVEAEAKSLG